MYRSHFKHLRFLRFENSPQSFPFGNWKSIFQYWQFENFSEKKTNKQAKQQIFFRKFSQISQ